MISVVFYCVLLRKDGTSIIKYAHQLEGSYPMTDYMSLEYFLDAHRGSELTKLSLEEAVYYGWLQ